MNACTIRARINQIAPTISVCALLPSNCAVEHCLPIAERSFRPGPGRLSKNQVNWSHDALIDVS